MWECPPFDFPCRITPPTIEAAGPPPVPIVSFATDQVSSNHKCITGSEEATREPSYRVSHAFQTSSSYELD